ncbi:Tyrosine protein phosphatase non receptor type [Trichuris trichiura]|uniref:protein-tyrosine-phosphatase n=1 Tax=Trichuris trichiura TaxID=36087 RepID=A0A077YX99_TRITR|nr:Tyrosine protein phosphatase non receptor type [Trichuris trichiura]
MPFKLCQNKRAGHYELSKEMYIVSVQLLDGSVLQCTLASESTGQVCLDYVCLRLNLRQSIFFGLRCKTNRMVYRWIELDKPLRKQFDKSEQNQLRLFFGVIYHTPNVHTITDEVTRYYFYLQMRADILEGRLLVSPQKAILLASYSLQVEFGDFDEFRHTVEVFRDWMLLPKHLTQSPQILEDLIRQVILGYKSLQGLPQWQAELLYISEAQQCEGYGEEYFPGRDEDGNDVFVGYYSEGLIVKRLQGPPLKYRWEEVCGIHCNKRNFTVNCAELSNLCFQMEDAETAKYAAFLFNLQSKFFRSVSAVERKNDAFLESDLSSCPRLRKVPFVRREGHTDLKRDLGLRIDSSSMYHLHMLNGNVGQNSRKAFSSVNLSLPYSEAQLDSLPKNGGMVTAPSCGQTACNSNCRNVTPTIDAQVHDSALAVTGMLSRVKLPAYRSAPDYETALSQPSLDEYNLAVWRELQGEQQRRAQMANPCSTPSSNVSSQSLHSTDYTVPSGLLLKQGHRNLEQNTTASSSNLEVGFGSHPFLNRNSKSTILSSSYGNRS